MGMVGGADRCRIYAQLGVALVGARAWDGHRLPCLSLRATFSSRNISLDPTWHVEVIFPAGRGVEGLRDSALAAAALRYDHEVFARLDPLPRRPLTCCKLPFPRSSAVDFAILNMTKGWVFMEARLNPQAKK